MKISNKLRLAEDNILIFYCPGCEFHHSVKIGEESKPHWTWNNDKEKPTFNPSILVSYTKTLLSNKEIVELCEKRSAGILDNFEVPHTKAICHSFVIEGKIQFLSDCTHSLAGQTIDLPDLPE